MCRPQAEPAAKLSVLEFQPEAELDLAVRELICATNDAKAVEITAVVDISIRLGQLRGIEQVEEISLELYPDRLPNIDVLGNA
mgnify:CR=1 FL=1